MKGVPYHLEGGFPAPRFSLFILQSHYPKTAEVAASRSSGSARRSAFQQKQMRTDCENRRYLPVGEEKLRGRVTRASTLPTLKKQLRRRGVTIKMSLSAADCASKLTASLMLPPWTT
jgi:hypothetical protein